MALTLTEQHELAVDRSFLDRVEQAVIDVAIDVSAEDPTTYGHEQRAALAYRVLHDSRSNAKKFAHGLVTHPSATVQPPDAGIVSFAGALWNAYAGVNPNAAQAQVEKAPASKPTRSRAPRKAGG